MPKDKEGLVFRAKKLVSNCFEVQSKSNEVLIFCKSCESKFKIDSVHLKTQYQSHLSPAKHKKSSEKNILQPSISGAIASSNANTTKNENYPMKLVTAFLEAGIPFGNYGIRASKSFFWNNTKKLCRM